MAVDFGRPVLLRDYENDDICGENSSQLAIFNAGAQVEEPERIYDLEDRLVAYTCRMIDVVEAMPKSRADNYIAGQLIKSCHSPTFNYGEAQAAESNDDFITS